MWITAWDHCGRITDAVVDFTGATGVEEGDKRSPTGDFTTGVRSIVAIERGSDRESVARMVHRDVPPLQRPALSQGRQRALQRAVPSVYVQLTLGSAPSVGGRPDVATST